MRSAFIAEELCLCPGIVETGAETRPLAVLHNTAGPQQLILSGPGAVFSLILLRALNTSVLKESSAAAGLREEMIASIRVVLSVSSLGTKGVEVVGEGCWAAAGHMD